MSHTVGLMRWVHAISFALAAAAVGAVACGERVYTGSDEIAVAAFDPSRAVEDEAFTDAAEFSERDIQALLERTPYGTKSVLADVKDGEDTAAAIVKRLAVASNLNPLELLVRLQMERGLLERAQASETDIGYAFNCGCPDGDVCVTNPAAYTGFRNQADCAAKSFRQGLDALAAPEGATSNGWKLDTARTTEDGISVTPLTKATAVLYNYTPYVGELGGGRAKVNGVSGYVEIRARLRAALRGEYDTADGGSDGGDAGADAGRSDASTAQCVSDAQCNNGVCNLDTRRCVECMPTRPERCTRERNGAVCLPSFTCGCGDDADCGERASGRVCERTRQKCVAGCRPASSSLASTGNQCPSGQVCVALQGSTSDVGLCVRATGDEGEGGGSPSRDGGRGGDRVDPPRSTPSEHRAPPPPQASAPGTQSRGGGEEAVEVGNGPDKTRRVGLACAAQGATRANASWLLLLAVLGGVAKKSRRGRRA